jgi:hypothetical protein
LKPTPETWPAEYRNSETHKSYSCHHQAEASVVFDDGPRYAAILGGEGGGKSVAGIIKVLDRLKRGCNGIMVSPDLPHFRRSLWPEFRRWCPWEQVVPHQRRRKEISWEPAAPFSLTFMNGAVLMCGGIEEPAAWEGPNVNFAHVDEARRCRNGQVLKVLSGRIRIPGHNSDGSEIPPQLWITTTPKMNWLHEYFGPLLDEDPHADFKAASRVIRLLTKDNEANLEKDFVAKRSQSLSEAERRLYLEAEWEDIEGSERFIESMTWWDACQEPLPPMDRRTSLVLAMDAGVDNDCFAVVGVSRHPIRPLDVAVRLVKIFTPPKGHNGKVDFEEVETFVRRICLDYGVKCIVFDPWQLHDMAQRLKRSRVAWLEEFSQQGQRLEADKQLLDLIMQRRLAHDGNLELRQHVDHANKKPDEDNKLRIVKRENSLKVDALVALSMAAYQSLKLRLSP